MAYNIFDSFKKRLNESCDTRFDNVKACGSKVRATSSTEEMFDRAFESVYGIKLDTPKSSLREGIENISRSHKSLTEGLNIPQGWAVDDTATIPDSARSVAFTHSSDAFTGTLNVFSVGSLKSAMVKVVYHITDNYTGQKYDHEEKVRMNSVHGEEWDNTVQKALDEVNSIVSNKHSGSHTSGILTEAFGDFPDWLTKFLARNKSVKDRLTRMGVDLANATYISGQLPQNARDAAFKDPTRLAVFRMVSSIDSNYEVIYIPGITDPDVYPDPNNRWTRYSASAISKKKLLQLTKEYGYIDMNDSRNSNIAKRTARVAAKQGMITRDRDAGQHSVRTNVEYATDENGRRDYDTVVSYDIKWVTKKGYDKSGYPLDPDKYERMLDNVGLTDYAVRLEMFYNKIEQARQRIIQLMSAYTVADSSSVRVSSSWNKNIFGDISRVVDNFSRAIDSYRDLEDAINQILADEEYDDERKDKRIHSAFQWTGKRVREYIKEVTDGLKQAENAEKI